MGSSQHGDKSQSPGHPQAGQAEEAQEARGYGPLARVPSGIVGLDTILNGGFLKGGIYFISGQPGAGKTILSNQIAFNHAAGGGRVVFASVLSESHARMFSHLSSLSFFNPEPIGNSLYFISGYGAAQSEGLHGLLALLQGAVRDNRATLLIVDGSLNAEAFAQSQLDFKEFIHRLQTYADAYGCTVLLLSSVDNGADTSETISGQTTVDGLIRLSNRLVGLRSIRDLQVQKFRGSGYLEGVHSLEITGDGVQIHPRLEAVVGGQVALHSAVEASRTRLTLGVEKLDEMLHGGVLAGSSTVLLGPPGSGKTLLGLTYLAEGARLGQPGLHFGFNEPPGFTVDAGDQIGLDISGHVAGGRIQMLWQPAVEGSLDVLAYRLLTAISEHKIQRLVIDGLDALDDINIHSERLPLFFTAMAGETRRRGVTTLSTVELDALFGSDVHIPIDGVSARVENIIFLRSVEVKSKLQRIISILKTRRTGHADAIRQFKISERGMEVGDELGSVAGLLTGVARPLHDTTG